MSPPPLGHVPGPPSDRDWRFDDSPILAYRPVSTKPTLDWRGYDHPMVQLFGSCVGQSIVAASFLAMAIAGTPIAFPAPLLPYAGSRILARASRETALGDGGCQARLAMQWCRDKGLVVEERWPETSENVNAVPPEDVWAEGACATLEAYYLIASGPGAPDAVRAALARGYCPIFAMVVDAKYEQLGGGVYDGPGGRVLGGHMQTIVGWSDAAQAFIVRNTWGKGYGDDGYFLVSEAFMARFATEIYVIQAAPEVR